MQRPKLQIFKSKKYQERSNLGSVIVKQRPDHKARAFLLVENVAFDVMLRLTGPSLNHHDTYNLYYSDVQKSPAGSP